MHFLLASLYCLQHREIVSRAYVPPRLAPAAVRVDCPMCGLVYVAQLTADMKAWELEAAEDVAVVRLAAECPDRAHQFEAGE